MTSREVNPKKVIDRACPVCGEMLEFIYRENRRGVSERCEITFKTRKRVSLDDVECDRVQKVSKYESKVIGKEYLHTVKYECKRCGKRWSEGQSVAHEFAYEELPIDYYASDGRVSPERIRADIERIRSGTYKPVRYLHEVEPRPVQGTFEI